MNAIKFLTTIAIVAMLVAGCSNDKAADVEAEVQVVQLAGSISKASSTSWDVSTGIGVFMMNSGTLLATAPLADNVCLSTGNGTNFVLASPIYYPVNGDAVDFVAYAPYRTTPVSDPYTYKVDVSNQASPAAIDLLYSTNATSKRKSSTPVGLSFDHKLSQVVLNIKPGAGMTATDLAGIQVRLDGMPTKVDFNLSVGTLSSPTAIASITPVEVNPTAGYLATFAAIAIPQSSATDRKLVVRLGSQEYSYVIPTNDVFQSGSSYSYSISVNATSVSVGSITVNDWNIFELNGYVSQDLAKVGDYYYSDGSYSTDYNENKTCIGIVFRGRTGVTPTTCGLVVSLNEQETAWSSEQVVTGAADWDSGVFNMEKIKATAGWQTSYPAFAWCDGLNSSSTGKPGWCLPSSGELGVLYQAWISNKTKFNNSLLGVGGVALSNRSYISSTEINSLEKGVVSFSNGNRLNGSKLGIQPGEAARAVLAF